MKGDRVMNERRMTIITIGLVAANLYLLTSTLAYGHWVANSPAQSVDWHNDQISRVIAEGNHGELDQQYLAGLDGKKCLEGSSFRFDVDDRYAFDIDETVQVEIEFYRHAK